MDRRRTSNNTNNAQYGRNRRGRGGGGGGGGRGRGGGGGRGGGRGGRGKANNFSWTAGSDSATSPSTPQGSWTAGGGGGGAGDDNNAAFEIEDFPREPQSGLIFGLTDKVVVPGSVNQDLLQGEILETLKRLPPDIVNLMLSQYDTCVREGGVRNKSAYMLGIINSGPRMGLPQGVVVPPNVKFSLMQGVVLDDLNALTVPIINTILGEFDKDMRERGSCIYDKYSHLADIIRKHKKKMPPPPPRKTVMHQYVIGAMPELAVSNAGTNNNHAHAQARNGNSHHFILNSTENGDMVPDVQSTDDEMEDTLTLLSNSLEKVQSLTESLAKVTGELVVEREKRNNFEAIAKSEQLLREATEKRLETTQAELERERALREQEQNEYKTSLKYEADRRAAIEKEIRELQEKIALERAEKHRAEDRLTALEEVLISERDVRDQERHGSVEGLPDFNSADFDSDCESK